jgi:hypothetical protein
VAMRGNTKKARVEEEGGGGAEEEEKRGFGPFGRRGRGSVMLRESTFPVALFPLTIFRKVIHAHTQPGNNTSHQSDTMSFNGNWSPSTKFFPPVAQVHQYHHYLQHQEQVSRLITFSK